MSTRRSRAGAVAAALAAVAAGAGAEEASRVDQGREIFKAQGCPQCHGFRGEGDGYLLGMLKEPVEIRDWTDPAAMEGITDEYMVRITKEGGEALGKSKVMIKYSHKMTDEEIETVVVFIRSLEGGPDGDGG